MTGSTSLVVAWDFLMQMPMDRTMVRAWVPSTTKENCNGLGRKGQTATMRAMPRASGGHGCRTPRAMPALMAMPVTPAKAMESPSSPISRGSAGGRPSTSAMRCRPITRAPAQAAPKARATPAAPNTSRRSGRPRMEGKMRGPMASSARYTPFDGTAARS